MVADGDATRGLDNGLAMVVTTTCQGSTTAKRKSKSRRHQQQQSFAQASSVAVVRLARFSVVCCSRTKRVERERERERERQRRTETEEEQKDGQKNVFVAVFIHDFYPSCSTVRRIWKDAVDEDVLCRARRVCQVTYVLSRGVFCRRRALSLFLSLSLSLSLSRR